MTAKVLSSSKLHDNTVCGVGKGSLDADVDAEHQRIQNTNRISKSGSVAARCQQIVDHYEAEAEAHKPEHEKARWLVEQLSPEERELAANTSYAYWFLSTQHQHQNLLDSARFATAMREASRHMDCAEDIREILKLLKATLEFHSRQKTWLYRTCMTSDNESETTTTKTPSATSSGDTLLCQQRRDRIHDEMAHYQTNVVRGHDKEDRAIFFAFPRKTAGSASPEAAKALVDSIVYTIERALACSEFRSAGKQDQMFCVVDAKGASCPPFKNLQAALGVLQRYYPGRLKHCVVLNAPYLVTGLFKMLKPFMHPITASKYVFPKAHHHTRKHQQQQQQQHPSLISDLIDESQAMPVLMPGRGRLTAEVSVDRMLYEVPFCELYDEHETPSATYTHNTDIDTGAGADRGTEQHPQERSRLKKKRPSIESESNSTCSLPLTESSSIDSDENQKSPKQKTGIRFHIGATKGGRRRKGKGKGKGDASKSKLKSKDNPKQKGKTKNNKLAVSVQSLAIGELAPSPKAASSEVVVHNVTINRRRFPHVVG